MNLLIGFLLSFSILLIGIIKGIYIGYSISISFLIFCFIAYRTGLSYKEIIKSSWEGGKNSFVVIKVFILIGLVTASWLVAGTIPSIVYYALNIMNPKFFVLFTFLATSMTSYMLGTSTGTASTMGIVLIIMARGGNININLVGGAILAACYVGDRCSPMSSSANLIANLTNIELYPMLKRFRKTTIVPFVLSVIFYAILSINNPLNANSNIILQNLNDNFIINIIILIPAIIMLTLSIFQVNVKISMGISIVVGIFIGLFIQKVELISLLKTLIFGFKLEPDNPLVDILKGGGLVSMLKLSFVIFVSCALAGILEEIKVFEKSYGLYKNVNNRKRLYLSTTLTSIVAAAYGGNQSIAVVMVNKIMTKVYKRLNVNNYELATDIGNTAIVIAPMIPWNVANLVIANTLEISPVLIVPYAFYLYAMVIYNYFFVEKENKPKKN